MADFFVEGYGCVYIYTFFYTYATLRGSQVQEVPMLMIDGPPANLRRLYRRSKPYNDEVGNLRLLVNSYDNRIVAPGMSRCISFFVKDLF